MTMSLTSYFLFILYVTTIVYTNVEGSPKFDIGVCYGFNGAKLAWPGKIVRLYQLYGIGKMRLFEPNRSMLHHLKGSGVEVTLGVVNQDIPTLASGEAAAEKWFKTNVKPYVSNLTIPYIAMGNEVVPNQYSEFILPAMMNLQNVLNKHGHDTTRVSTVVHMGILTSTYPPSASVFTDQAKPFMVPIVKYLSDHGSPLFINVYPYFAYASNPDQIRQDYALFTATKPVVHDGDLSYTNLFDAMVDSFVWAMEKAGFPNVDLVVTESGWPHAGNGNYTTPELAKTYNKNFMNHILRSKGTPKKKGTSIVSGYIFSFTDENRKPEGVEQSWGMVQSPSLKPNYNIFRKIASSPNHKNKRSCL